MSVRKQSDKQRLYKMLLSHDDLIHAGHQVCYERTLFLYALIQFLDINIFTHKINFSGVKYITKSMPL